MTNKHSIKLKKAQVLQVLYPLFLKKLVIFINWPSHTYRMGPVCFRLIKNWARTMHSAWNSHKILYYFSPISFC